MLNEDPYTGHLFIQVVKNGERIPFSEETILYTYPYCVVTGVGYTSGNVIRYTLISVTDLNKLIQQELGADAAHTISCYPAHTWGAAEAIATRLRAVEETIAIDGEFTRYRLDPELSV